MAFAPKLAPQVAVLCFLCLCLWTCSAGRNNQADPLQGTGEHICFDTIIEFFQHIQGWLLIFTTF